MESNQATQKKMLTKREKARDMLIKNVVGFGIIIGFLTCACEGPNGEITWVNFAGLAVLAGAAYLANLSEKKGWVFFDDDENEI